MKTIQNTPLICLAIVLSVLSLCLSADRVAAQATEQSLTFAESLAAISHTYKVNIVADAFDGETPRLAPSEWKGRTPADAIQRIARWRERDVVVMDGIYVLRHKRWAHIRQLTAPPTYKSQGEGRGSVEILREDKPENSDSLLPARSVSISAIDLPSARLASELRRAASWSVRVAPDLGERRLHVHVKEVTVSAVLGCVAYVLNAGPEVVLRPSKEQLAMEEDEALALDEATRKRLRASDKLRSGLEKLLTPGQRTALDNGEFVPLSLGSLPLSLRDQALDYIKMSAALNADVVPSPDLSRSQDFLVRFRPLRSGSLWRMLGVVMSDATGHEYYF